MLRTLNNDATCRKQETKLSMANKLITFFKSEHQNEIIDANYMELFHSILQGISSSSFLVFFQFN
jgi:hypothetical protein